MKVNWKAPESMTNRGGNIISCLVILSIIQFVELNNIIFQKYCESGTNPPIIPCDGSSSSGFFLMSDKNIPSDNCTVTLSTDPKSHLFISFTNVKLGNKVSLSILYNNEEQNAVLAGEYKCPNESCRGLQFQSGKSSQNLTFQYHKVNLNISTNDTGFRAVFTAFDFVNSKTGRCEHSNRFLCLNGHCISPGLVCNGHNNCGDLSDERQCQVVPKDTIWGIVVIAIAVVSVTFVPLFCFLASRGTRNVVKSVTLPSRATPLYSAVSDQETASLLTSSGAPIFEYYDSNPFDRQQVPENSYQIGVPSSSNGSYSHS